MPTHLHRTVRSNVWESFEILQAHGINLYVPGCFDIVNPCQACAYAHSDELFYQEFGLNPHCGDPNALPPNTAVVPKYCSNCPRNEK